MRTLLPRPLILLVAGLVLIAGAAVADPVLEESETTLYLHFDNCGADIDTYLNVEQPNGLNGCGYAAGVPLNEVFHVLGEDLPDTYASRGEGFPLTVDTERTVEGEIHVHSWFGVGAGVGQVIVDGALSVRALLPGQTSPRTVQVGTFSEEGVATPADDTVALPFSLDLPESLEGAEILAVTLDLVTRGIHVDSGIQAAGGLSQLTLPTLVEVEDE